MKLLWLALVVLATACSNVHSQGTFLYANFSQPTRVETLDGPLAGPEFFGQMLAGASPDQLFPVGPSAIRHREDGTLGGGFILTVPDILCLETAYIQMVAWDGRLWGSDISNVPESQFGRTDAVPHILAGCLGEPASGPRFNQPAIVPPVPEPSTIMLVALGACVLVLHHAFRGRRKRPFTFDSVQGRDSAGALSRTGST